MKHLERIEMAAKDLIRYYIPHYSFVWDRSKRRKGECRRHVQQIGISKPLAELNSFECMLLTVIHEIAHALSKHGHGEDWKQMCLNLGGDGKRTYSSSEVVTPTKKWLGECPNCYKTVRRHRRGKMACATCCKGVFNEDYLFIWKEEN